MSRSRVPAEPGPASWLETRCDTGWTVADRSERLKFVFEFVLLAQDERSPRHPALFVTGHTVLLVEAGEEVWIVIVGMCE